jgi:NAD(P)-dependent dehydrogenase (short-subunit alcohol dehydrogenase family)
MLFDQQIAMIGGSAGIGFAVADAAADAGAHVVTGSSSQTKLNKALGQFSEKVTGLVVDVTKEESVRILRIRQLSHHWRLVRRIAPSRFS